MPKAKAYSLFSVLPLLGLAATTLALLVDTFLFPGATLKHLRVDSKVLLLIFAGLALALRAFRLEILPNWLRKLNNHFLLPILAFLSFFFILLENITYPNFVFNTFHLYPEQFLILFFLFGFVSYLEQSFPKAANLLRQMYVLGPLLLILLIRLNLSNPSLFKRLVHEDSFFEYSQFLFYLGTAVTSFFIARNIHRARNRLWIFYLLLGIGIFFVSLEEISWGQRMFGIKTPANLARINYQKEITVHNINGVKDLIPFVYIALGLWGGLGWRILERVKIVSKKYRTYFAPPPHLSFYFLAVAIYFTMHMYAHFYYEVGTAVRTSIPRWQEVAEAYFAAGFLVFALENYHRSLRLRSNSLNLYSNGRVKSRFSPKHWNVAPLG